MNADKFVGGARLPKDLNIQPEVQAFRRSIVRDANSRAEPGVGHGIDRVLKQ